MQSINVPANNALLHSSRHNLDSVAGMGATAANETATNVVGVTGAKSGLSVQSGVMKCCGKSSALCQPCAIRLTSDSLVLIQRRELRIEWERKILYRPNGSYSTSCIVL